MKNSNPIGLGGRIFGEPRGEGQKNGFLARQRFLMTYRNRRQVYSKFWQLRLFLFDQFTKEAQDARTTLIWRYVHHPGIPRVRARRVSSMWAVILGDSKSGFLGCKSIWHETKLLNLDPLADLEMIRLNLTIFWKNMFGETQRWKNRRVAISCITNSRWLTQFGVRFIQTSRPHMGFSCCARKKN